MTFKKFINRKEAEFENLVNPSADYHSSSLFGVKAITSRQPLFIHAALSTMERSIPLTSKAEIIYEAISQAYKDYISSLNPLESQFVESQLHLESQFLLSQSSSENDSFHFSFPDFSSQDALVDHFKSLFEAKNVDYLLLPCHEESLYKLYSSFGG